jgi:hypothetical protein
MDVVSCNCGINLGNCSDILDVGLSALVERCGQLQKGITVGGPSLWGPHPLKKGMGGNFSVFTIIFFVKNQVTHYSYCAIDSSRFREQTLLL